MNAGAPRGFSGGIATIPRRSRAHNYETTGLGATRGCCDYTAYDANDPGGYIDQTSPTYLSGITNQALYEAPDNSITDLAQKGAVNLAWSFITQRFTWWGSAIVETAVEIITGGSPPYSAAVSGWTDPWYSGGAAGGIVYNDWASPAWGKNDANTLFDVYKTSNSNQYIQSSARFTLYMDDSYYNAQPEETWGVHQAYMSYAWL